MAAAIDSDDLAIPRPPPLRQLLLVSIYWLGLVTIFAELSSVLAGRLQYEGLVPSGTEGSALFRMTAAGIVVAMIIQPTFGSISDHTTRRLGRRKPYIGSDDTDGRASPGGFHFVPPGAAGT